MYVSSYDPKKGFEAYEINEKDSVLSFKLDPDNMKFLKKDAHIDFNNKYTLDVKKIDNKVRSIDESTVLKITKFKEYLESRSLIKDGKNIDLQGIGNLKNNEIEMLF